MGIGKQFRDEQIRYEDPLSGREITCLTNWLGHSWQFYFTHPCWIDNGRAFLFHSERDNASNYFRYELATGDIVQLTDLQGEEAFFKSCLCPATRCLYYWSGNELCELQVDSLKQRLVYKVEPPFLPDDMGTKLSTSADGRYVVAVLDEYRMHVRHLDTDPPDNVEHKISLVIDKLGNMKRRRNDGDAL